MTVSNTKYMQAIHGEREADPAKILAEASIDIAPQQVVGLPAPREELQQDANFDLENKKSMINLVPKYLREYAVVLPQKYFEMTEDELKRECFPTVVTVDGAQICEATDEARRLRLSFWDEYDRACRYGEKMEMTRVTSGICGQSWFNKKFISNQKLLAWMLTPPSGYVALLSDILELSGRRLLEIVKLPLERDAKGNWDTKLMTLQKSIYERADNRLKGAIAQIFNQTVDQRNLNVNVQATPGQAGLPSAAATPTFEEINERIRLMEAKSLALQAPSRIEVELMKEVSPPTPAPIEVEYKEEVIDEEL